MVDTLLVEAVLASVLAAILGYRMDRGSGVKALGRLTFIIIILTVGFALLVARRDLAQPPELVIGEIAIWSYVIGGTLSYFLSGSLGVLPVQGGTLGAALLCIGITALAGRLNEWVGALALVVIVIGIGTGGVRWFSGKILRGKGVKPLTALWFGLCAASLLGYLAAGRAGTFLITIPAQLLFWGLLYYLSGHTLPIDYEDERAREEHYRDAAFKCLLTFALGTNYPYSSLAIGRPGRIMTRKNQNLASGATPLCRCSPDQASSSMTATT
ncbi:MAG: hypothetical protein KKB13_14615 [Chloroflexi bacterium]|nr:hypothetical protein [Chloroflexota bacterium]